MSPSNCNHVLEETDIDDGLPDGMEGVVEGAGAKGPPKEQVFVRLAEELELLDPDVLKPPTPPLHRFPSWVRSVLRVTHYKRNASSNQITFRSNRVK